MKLLFAAASTAALLVAAPAFAQSPPPEFYGNLGYTFYGANIEAAGSAVDDEEISLGTVDARLGVRFARYFGVEGEAGFGVQEESLDTGFGDVDVKISSKFAGYAVGFLPVAPNVDLFARVGYGTMNLEVEGLGASASEDDSVFTYGAGGQFMFDGLNGVRAEYTRYEFDAGGDIDSIGIAYVRRFR